MSNTVSNLPPLPPLLRIPATAPPWTPPVSPPPAASSLLAASTEGRRTSAEDMPPLIATNTVLVAAPNWATVAPVVRGAGGGRHQQPESMAALITAAEISLPLPLPLVSKKKRLKPLPAKKRQKLSLNCPFCEAEPLSDLEGHFKSFHNVQAPDWLGFLLRHANRSPKRFRINAQRGAASTKDESRRSISTQTVRLLLKDAATATIPPTPKSTRDVATGDELPFPSLQPEVLSMESESPSLTTSPSPSPTSTTPPEARGFDVLAVAAASQLSSEETRESGPQFEQPSLQRERSPIKPSLMDYFNLCTFRCPMCRATSSSRTLLEEHFSTAHGRKAAQLGSNVLVRRVLGRCELCDCNIRWESGTVASHLKVKHHGFTIQSYFDIFESSVTAMYESVRTRDTSAGVSSNTALKRSFKTDINPSRNDRKLTLGNHCRFKCLECRATLPCYSEFIGHLMSIHGMSSNEYRTRHRTIEPESAIYHRCRICAKRVLFDRTYLRQHTKTVHGIALNAYYQQHVSGSSNNSRRSDAFEKKEVGTRQRFKALLSVASGDNCAEDVLKGCSFSCPECPTRNPFETDSLGQLVVHVANVHNDPDDSDSEVGKPDLDELALEAVVTRKWHKCAICKTILLKDPELIKEHLKSRHTEIVGLGEYVILYGDSI